MRHAGKALAAVLLLAGAIAAGLASTVALAQSYVHAPTQIAFPEVIAGFPRHQIEDYESRQAGLGVSARYQASKEIRIDVYVYTLGVAQIPDDIDHPLMTKLRNQTELDIRAAAKTRGYELRTGESAKLEVQTAKGIVPVLYDSFVQIAPGGSQNTFVWLWPARNHFIKVRLTRLPGDHDPRQVRDFVETLVGLTK